MYVYNVYTFAAYGHFVRANLIAQPFLKWSSNIQSVKYFHFQADLGKPQKKVFF